MVHKVRLEIKTYLMSLFCLHFDHYHFNYDPSPFYRHSSHPEVPNQLISRDAGDVDHVVDNDIILASREMT